jgi:hypothetical protein
MVFGLLCAFMLVSSVPLDSARAIDRRSDDIPETLEHTAHHVGKLIGHERK